MTKKRVLIISHTFPPLPGVGGRRWSKFAKYLQMQGVDVFVFREKRKVTGKESAWSQDVNVLNPNNIYTYKTYYPNILQKKVLNLFDKIKYKIALWWVNQITNGNPFDKTALIKYVFLKQLNSIVKQNDINNIIVSGAPFNLLYYVSIFKRQNLEINVVADIRDPWTWGQNYGIQTINKIKIQNEKIKQDFVVNTVDFITVPTDSMLGYLKATYSKNIKCALLPHGFDKMDIKKNISSQIKNKQIKIAYFGEEYPDTGKYFEEIALALNEKVSNFEISFYVKNKRYQSIFKSKGLINKKVFYKEMLPANEIYDILKAYNFALLIMPNYAKDYISTKFYEIIYSELPIIFISEKGKASNFIVENQLGIFLEQNSVFDFFTNSKIANDFKIKPYEKIGEFEMQYITNDLLKLIK